MGAAVEGIAVGGRLTAPPVQPFQRLLALPGGPPHLCERGPPGSIGRALPGAFAERLRVPGAVLGRNVSRLPDGLGFQEGAGGAAGGGRARGRPGGAESWAGRGGAGLGPIGLQTAQVLLAEGVCPVLGSTAGRCGGLSLASWG